MNVIPCKKCKRPLSFVRRSTTGRNVPVDAAPLRLRRPRAIRGDFLIVDGRDGYTFDDMETRLNNPLAFDRDRRTVDDFPWHTVHVCTPTRGHR